MSLVPEPEAKGLWPSCRAQQVRNRRDALSRFGSASRRLYHRFDDLRVAGAAAEIPGKPFADLVCGGLGLLLEQMKCGKNHSWGAYAALCAATFQKSLLKRAQSPVSGQTFDRSDSCILGLKHGDEATIHQHAVDQYAARATLAFSTAFLRSRQPQLVPQHVQQALHRIHVHGHRSSVYIQ